MKFEDLFEEFQLEAQLIREEDPSAYEEARVDDEEKLEEDTD